MYADLSEKYATYLKFLISFKVKYEFLNLRMTDVNAKAKAAGVVDLLAVYEQFDALISQIFNFLEFQHFCQKTRLWSHVVLHLLLDLLKIYQVFYVLISEVLERFPNLGIDQANKVLVMYFNFNNFTKALKDKAPAIMRLFEFHLTLPKFHNTD